MQKDQKNKDRKNLDTLLRKVMKEKQKNKKEKRGKKVRKKARNDFEKAKKHPYPSHRSKAIYVKVHIFSPFVQYDFPLLAF